MQKGAEIQNPAMSEADGYSKEQAKTYGTLVGTSEAALQYLLGGISKLGCVSTEQSKEQIKEDGEKDLQSGTMLDDAHLEIMELNDSKACREADNTSITQSTIFNQLNIQILMETSLMKRL